MCLYHEWFCFTGSKHEREEEGEGHGLEHILTRVERNIADVGCWKLLDTDDMHCRQDEVQLVT